MKPFGFVLLFAALGSAYAQKAARLAPYKEVPVPIKAERSVNAPIRLSDIMEAPQYIRITSEGVVGKIGDIKYQNGRFYVLDMDHSSLLVLDGRPFLPVRGAGDRVLSYVEYDPDNVLFQQAVQAVGPTENPVLVVAKLK